MSDEEDLMRHGPLPAERRDRSLEMVRRSLPQAERVSPDLPAEAALEMRRAQNTRALLYAAMEDDTDEVLALARDIEGSGIVVDVIEPGDEDSLVTSIDSVDAELDAEPRAVAGRRA